MSLQEMEVPVAHKRRPRSRYRRPFRSANRFRKIRMAGRPARSATKKRKALKQIAQEAAQAATKAALLKALAECNNNVSEAAKLLGISRCTCYRMMRRCSLEFSREVMEK